jgi:hypothetical protein
MGYMTVEYTFADNAFAELSGQNIKFWSQWGLPDYEGSLEGFKTQYPKHFQLLLDNKVIKAK